MRTFIAIELSDEAKDYLYNLQKELKNELKDAKISWVAKKNLHLTLKFLGETSEKQLTQLKPILSSINFKKFKIHLNKTGIFKSNSAHKVIWVDFKPVENVLSLQRCVDEETLPIFSGEQQFKAHITLGRIKALKKKNITLPLTERLLKPIEFEVQNFELIQSTLTKDGPQYKILETYELR
jgi:RNA 2',3'-cyclic 3'-phosphodiesterase